MLHKIHAEYPSLAKRAKQTPLKNIDLINWLDLSVTAAAAARENCSRDGSLDFNTDHFVINNELVQTHYKVMDANEQSFARLPFPRVKLFP